MSLQERRSIVNVISTILIVVFYSGYMMDRYPDASAYSKDVFHFWGAFFLILIPVSIAAKIVTMIVFAIINTIATQEEDPAISMTDERDTLIELKASRNSLYVFAIGVILAMGSLVIEMPPSVMFVILFVAGFVSDMISEISQFYLYRRGF